MSSTAFDTNGAFSWTELLTSDVAGARRFYGSLLGWTFEDMDSGSTPYTIIRAGEHNVGGLMAIPPAAKGMAPAWGAYVTVDDVDKLTARVAGLGGKVLAQPRDIPGVGRFAVIQDPQGAAISLITYEAK